MQADEHPKLIQVYVCIDMYVSVCLNLTKFGFPLSAQECFLLSTSVLMSSFLDVMASEYLSDSSSSIYITQVNWYILHII